MSTVSSRRSTSSSSQRQQQHHQTQSNNNNTTSTFGSEVSASTSVGWSGDYCKKMMALNWDYTCGPLRVVQVGPHNHHWARLHAPGYSVLPSADGTLQHFHEGHKHVTDADLLRQVLRSGIAKIKRDPKEKLLAPRTPIKEVDVDLMKERLIKGSVPLPPARPPQTVFNQVQHYDDASSVFSHSDTRSAAAASVPLSASELRKRDEQQNSVARKASGSEVSASSSKRPPSAKEVRQTLSSVREQNQSVSSELALAKKKLEAIEKIVEERESSRRSSAAAAGAAIPQNLPKRDVQNASVTSQQTNTLSLNARRELANDLSISRRAVTPFC